MKTSENMGGGASKNPKGARKKGEIERMCGLARSTTAKNQKRAAAALEKIRSSDWMILSFASKCHRS